MRPLQPRPDPETLGTFADVTRRRLTTNAFLARSVGELIEYPERWIRRRVERIELESLDSVRSYVSLDIWLPARAQERLAIDDGQRILLPVGFGFKGEPLEQFDLTADGDAASLLSIHENQILSAAVLRTLLEPLGLRWPRRDLETLCGPIDDAHLRTLLRSHRYALRALPIVARRRAHSLLRMFGQRYVLYASVPLSEDRSAQRHVRFSQTKQRQSDDGGRTGPAGLRTRVEAEIRLTDAAFASRYHLDLSVPEGLHVDEASLVR